MSRLPSETVSTEWRSNWESIQPALSKVRQSLASLKVSSLKVMRVSQLDSEILDNELVDILKEQLWSALSLFKPTMKERFEPELLALLNLMLFKLSVYESSTTYGAQLQNLKYRNEKMHKGPCGQYVWTRVSRMATDKGWGELDEEDIRNKIYRLLQYGEKYWKFFSFINFLIFLWNGKYHMLIDRLLSMRLVYTKKSMNRQVSFEFLNRQMVWHAFTEFLLFMVPLINVEKLKMKIMHNLLPKSYLISSKGYSQLPTNQCAICHDNGNNTTEDYNVYNPYETNCGHQYCYYCIQSKLSITGNEWYCLRCGERVTDIKKFIEIAE
ncbi:peroxisome assembly protein (Peroxin-2) [Rhizopus stolonifer]|uniref:RING-type E3 ubiquitin transferase (cysteine targeting) n=1 Tax=Rhizopus stolonifer TaxID=4846 RepID=A0A367KTU7_RHIST|nr:peroxisome assembly protein (Peroxin-2) [Rhizopus stolonifer]